MTTSDNKWTFFSSLCPDLLPSHRLNQFSRDNLYGKLHSGYRPVTPKDIAINAKDLETNENGSCVPFGSRYLSLVSLSPKYHPSMLNGACYSPNPHSIISGSPCSSPTIGWQVVRRNRENHPGPLHMFYAKRGRCFKCGLLGHYKSRCRFNALCFKCKSPYHSAAICRFFPKAAVTWKTVVKPQLPLLHLWLA